MAPVLASWNNTPARQAIVDFVNAVSDPDGEQFVPPPERVATFDNDGTLWCEKPAYIQLYFAIERLKQLAETDAARLEKPAFRAAAAGDTAYFAGLYPDHLEELAEILYDSHAGMSQAAFASQAYRFLSEVHHPRYDVPFKECVYLPMVELLHFLRAHQFKVFIASAGGMSFVRTVSEEIYEIPRENVIGSNIIFELGRQGDLVTLQRRPGLVQPFSDGPGKPLNIELHIGRPPILAAGNADGDLEMLEYTASSGKPFLNLLLRHDDAAREYAYDSGAERVQQQARSRGWTIISMAVDFRKVFSFSTPAT